MADYIGLKLGNYRIVRLIGRGGFANVYLGEHIYLKIPAAIKVLNIQLMNDALENFLNEARIVALLEHPGIVRVLEFGVEDGVTPFLVMNYVEDGTLRQHYPRKSTLPWSRILSYTRQVAEALQYAHDHGVIHRDVKPENMLLGKNQRVQLSDFGLALLAQNMPHFSGSAGTTSYMAPEQLQGHPCRASDQYGLGVVVYEWLCGSLPFTGSEREMTVQQLYAAPPSLRTKVPGLSPDIEQVLVKALAKDPQARFDTVQEFAEALEHAVTSEALLDREERATSPNAISPVPLFQQSDSVSSEGSSSHLMQQQGAFNALSASNFFPQLPLLVYESPLTNSGRILQPSLGPSISSLEHLSFPTTILSEEDTPQSTPAFLSFSTPASQQFPDLFSAPAFLSATPGTIENEDISLPQAQNSGTGTFHVSRRAVFIALIGIVLFCLILLAGIETWSQNVHAIQKPSLNQHIASPTTSHATATTHNTPPRGAGSPTTTHHSTNAPVASALPTALPGSTPIVAKVPTPASIPTAGTQSTPVHPTPTPVVPLTVAIVSAPNSAVAGSTITVVTQASKGGVTISLDGVVRHFGQQTADSQGVATFQITVPLQGNRIALTATATDTNGNQAQSGTKPIKITAS